MNHSGSLTAQRVPWLGRHRPPAIVIANSTGQCERTYSIVTVAILAVTISFAIRVVIVLIR